MDFSEKIKVKAIQTQKSIKTAIRNFELFNKTELTNENIYDILQSWINYNDDKLNPKTIKLYFEHLKSYLYYKGFKLYQEDIKQKLTFPKAFEEEKHPLKLEEIQQILETAPYKKKALYLLLLSSGLRIGEACKLTKKDVYLTLKRPMIKVPAKITKTRRGRTTFISSEAWRFLQPIISKLNQDDYIFGTKQNSEDVLFNRYCAKVGLNQKYESGINQITLHSFRAYFITKVARYDENLSKILAGQRGYLLQYDRLTEEEKLEHYLEFEKELLIFDNTKLKHDLIKAKSENISIQVVNEKLDSLYKIVEDITKEKFHLETNGQ